MILKNAKHTITLLALLSVSVSHVQAGKGHAAVAHLTVLAIISGATYGGWKLCAKQTEQSLKINTLTELVEKLEAAQKANLQSAQTVQPLGASIATPLLETEYVKVDSFQQSTQQALQANRTALLNLGRAFNGKLSADKQLQEKELIALVAPLQAIEQQLLQQAITGSGKCNVA